MKANFIYQDEKSHKFWDIETNGTDLTVQYGKVGTTGQSQTKQFASEEECKKAADKLIAEKVKKGYNKVDSEEINISSEEQAGRFAPPDYTYYDLITMARYLEENHPDEELEIHKVEGEHIEAMEAISGFEMPSAYVDYWLNKGYFFFSKEDFICALYCFNVDGQDGNNFYNMLSFYQQFYRVEFELVHEERDYLAQCCWVVGLVITGPDMRFYVADPLGNVHVIHFPKGLKQTDNEDFAAAMAPLMDVRQLFVIMIRKSPETIEVTTPADTNEEEEKEEEAEEKDEMSYAEALELLGVDQIFDYWDEKDGEFTSGYESEEEYFEDCFTIEYHDGDLTIEGDLRTGNFIIVNGNLDVKGRIDSQYYVTGNTTVDYLILTPFQKTMGKETIRYVASAQGEDDERVHPMPEREINAPYFFSWYYDIACFDFAPETVITAVYDYDDLSSYETDNLFLMWHDYAYAFKSSFYYSIEKSNYAVLEINTRSFYEAIKGGQHPFLDGVTAEGISLVRKGLSLEQENDTIGAYQLYKEAISKSPGYQPAYEAAARLLTDQKAYKQAMELYAKAIPLTPEKVLYDINSMEKGGIAAIRSGEYDKAIEWAQIGLQKNKEANFLLRIIGEALILMGEPKEAKSYLEKSIEIKSIFTNNWLLGLIYFQQGDKKKAETYYKVAVEKNEKARPYTEHTDLNYIYGENVTSDWDTRKPVSEKGQEYWNNFFAETMDTYGPDMYQRIGIFSSAWILGKLAKIPVEFRSGEMLLTLLDHKTKGHLDVTGSVIASFDPAFLTEEIVFHAVKRDEPAQYSDIPAQFYSEQLLRSHPQYFNLSVFPADKLTYEFCFEAVSKNYSNYQVVPEQFRDERMNIALIAGGNLGQTHVKVLPSKYSDNEYIKQAIDIHIEAITHIPAPFVDKEIYDRAVAKYGNDPLWPFIAERYDRNRWQYGSQSDLEHMGKRVRKFGIDIFDHVNVNHISKQSYSYYKKHLGHLPEFAEKVKTFGWEKNSKKVSEYDEQKEFDYDTFRKVWACFWDEAFIIKALDKKSDREHLYNLPKKYMTQKICDVAVKNDSYAFAHVPRQFITEKMCKTACSMDYGSALEYVPLEMRTSEVCEASVALSAENIKFVPVKHRTLKMCAVAIARENDLTVYIPHVIYTEVIEWSVKHNKSKFSKDFLLLHAGIGLIIDKKYGAAREKLKEVGQEYASYHYQAVYYAGWTLFLEGDEKTAREFYIMSQAMLKDEDISDSYKLGFPYETFQLRAVPDVYALNWEQFDEQMKEATALVQNAFYEEALTILADTEKLLTDSQCSEMRWWAYVWDHQRFALYEADKRQESYDLCYRIIAELGKINLWDYLEEFNIIRAALRAANNNLAYRYYETAIDLAGVKEGLNHIKTTMKTIAPIENKGVLYPFYETQALLLYKAMGFDPSYRKDLEKVVAKIEKLKQKGDVILSDEYEKIKL